MSKRDPNIENLESGVYFIYAPNQNMVKIGRSRKIEIRFRQLRTGFMDKGVLLFGILTGEEVKLEFELHNRFSTLRSHGEWFIMTKELELFIKSCHLTYQNIKVFNDFMTIHNKLSYSSLGMFNLIIFLKKLQNKILIPIILLVFGLIIAYYNYSLEAIKPYNRFMIMLSYLYFATFPIAIPILAKMIIEYQSVKIGIVFCLLIITTFVVEATNIAFGIDKSFITIFRALVLTLYIPFAKNIFMVVLAKYREEDINLKAQEIISKKRADVNSLLILREKLKNTLVKINSVRNRTIYILTALFYIMVHLHILLISSELQNTKAFTLAIFDCSLILWLILSIIPKFFKNINASRILRIKIFILPGSLFLVNAFLIGVYQSMGLFWEILFITMLSLLPVSIVFSLTANKQRKSQAQLEKIDEHLSEI